MKQFNRTIKTAAEPTTCNTFVFANAHHNRRAFTLTELIVAIGVTVMLVLGIGKIFSMTKDTISIGEATASLNQYSRTIERLIRDDLGHITTDGFLVIRNERLGKSTTIPERQSSKNNREVFLNIDDHKLYIEDEIENPVDIGIRRMDQLVFFATGDYTSYQFGDAYGDGLQSGQGVISRNDTSTTARLWYGHSLRAINMYDSSRDPVNRGPEIKEARGMQWDAYRARFADDKFDPNQSIVSQSGANSKVDAVNVYAQNWILSRQASMLLRREAAGIPRNPQTGFEKALYARLSFTPSFSEFFNESDGYYVPPLYPPQYSLSQREDYRSLRRRNSPGYVDLIDMDLMEVQQAVTDYGYTYLEEDFRGKKIGDMIQHVDPIGKELNEYEDWSFDSQIIRDSGVPSYITKDEDRSALQDEISERWLAGQWLRMATATGRIRAESTPPSLSRYDQMLTHATLTPGCSNFEVAWSTGVVEFPTGNIVWYDIDTPANPYVGVAGQSSKKRHDHSPTDPRAWYLSELSPPALSGDQPFGNPLWKGKKRLEEEPYEDLYYAMFGYFVPKIRDGGLKAGSGSDLNQREDRSEAWPWPKMLRIRMTLHDQQGEINGGRTFEFIVSLPEPDRGS